jgi:DNA-binding Lrp family transcriptional regulator
MKFNDLDLKDRQILYELDLDSRRPVAQIAKKLRLSKQIVDYRIKKLIKENVISWFQTVIDTYKLGYSKYKIYLSLENADKKVISSIIDYLKKQDKTEWVATCSGKYDIIAGYLVKDVYEFENAIKELDNKFSQYIDTRDTTISLSVAHWRKEYLLINTKIVDAVYQGGNKDTKTIDNIDEKIIRVLANNANIPTIDISQRIKINPKVVAYRIKNMKKDKIILYHNVTLNLNKFDWIFCKAIIKFKNLTNERYNEFFNYCNNIKNLTYMLNCIGEWDQELDFEIENFNKFHEVMLDLRDKFSDIIKHYDFVIVMNEDKLDYYPGSLPSLLDYKF